MKKEKCQQSRTKLFIQQRKPIEFKFRFIYPTLPYAFPHSSFLCVYYFTSKTIFVRKIQWDWQGIRERLFFRPRVNILNTEAIVCLGLRKNFLERFLPWLYISAVKQQRQRQKQQQQLAIHLTVNALWVKRRRRPPTSPSASNIAFSSCTITHIRKWIDKWIATSSLRQYF